MGFLVMGSDLHDVTCSRPVTLSVTVSLRAVTDAFSLTRPGRQVRSGYTEEFAGSGPGAHPRGGLGGPGLPPWDLKNTIVIFRVSSVKLRDLHL